MIRSIPLLGLAALALVTTSQVMAQDRVSSFAALIAHACLPPTTVAAVEIPRAQAALKGLGLPVVNETAEMGFYGDPGGAFATVAANRGKLACTVMAPPEVLSEPDYHAVAAQIAAYIAQIYPSHSGGHNPPHGYGWFASHGTGEELVITLSYDQYDGLNVGSSTPRDK